MKRFSRRKIIQAASVIVFCLQGATASAQTFEYTVLAESDNQIALGYEVPIPVDSLTPIDGFRTYSSLEQRHLQLSMQYDQALQLEVGSTVFGRTIWAYQLSDSDDQRPSGGFEASALINAGIHAREWQSPEASTGLMENLLQNATNAHIEAYLLENLNVVLIPVLNIDGFLQTQRFPQQVTISPSVPRDGRMRRKNLNNVDEDIATLEDNTFGVDLNRNNAPFWATSNRSSSDPSSLVHHGSSAGSEPETQALQQAASLANSTRLAFYMDMHSFSQLWFMPRTNSSSRNAQADFIGSAMRTGTNNRYLLSPSAAGAGIGSTDEYFANTFQIPSYTLEIEPESSATQYGGFGVSHDGFILPNSEVARMREEISRSTFAGLYAAADVPILESLQILDEDGAVLVSGEWESSTSQRTLEVTVDQTPQADIEYRLRLQFNKPMRALDEAGNVTDFGALSTAVGGIDASWQIGPSGNLTESVVDFNEAEWATNLQGSYRRYQTDTLETRFQFPTNFDWDNSEGVSLELRIFDMAGFLLDANPATVAQWQNGQWQNFENAAGNPTTIGGTDSSMVLVQRQAEPEPAPVPLPPLPDPVPEGGGSMTVSLLGFLLCMLGLRRRQLSRKSAAIR